MGQLLSKLIFNQKVVGKVVPSSLINNIGKSIVTALMK